MEKHNQQRATNHKAKRGKSRGLYAALPTLCEDAPLLFVAISDGVVPNRPLVAEGYQQAVRIGKHVGIYTQGNWQSATPPGATNAQPAAIIWDTSTDVAWLTWQADGLNYLLYAQELGFTAETMAKIAESME